jgi:methanogenic corrinoid protein MtbC1
MTDQTGFAAELLKRSAAGYAGTAAELLLERRPALRKQAGAFAAWKSNLTQRTIELAAALAAGEESLFTERLNWARKTFIAREQDDTLLQDSVACLRESLAGSLPPPAAKVSLDFLDTALDAISGPMPAPDASELDPAREADKLALRYLQLALEGKSPDAIQLILDAVDGGLAATSAYVDVLLPAQREIGRMWHADEVNVAEEHIVSATTSRVMAILAHTAPRIAINGKTVVSACVPSNVHDLGIRALSDLFYLHGWNAVYLGADVPDIDMPGAISYFAADLLLLSATLSVQIAAATDVVRAVRERSERPVRIMVGGAAFAEAPDLWRQTGADAYVGDAIGALRVGAELVGLDV